MRISKRRFIPGLAPILESHLRWIYGSWHACALPKSERGIPKGTLCDDCNEQVRAHVLDILKDIDAAETKASK